MTEDRHKARGAGGKRGSRSGAVHVKFKTRQDQPKASEVRKRWPLGAGPWEGPGAGQAVPWGGRRAQALWEKSPPPSTAHEGVCIPLCYVKL